MAKVDVEPRVLLWAVQRKGNIEKIEEKFPKLTNWLNNDDQPTLKQLEKLAKATSTPLGYFFLTEPPKEELPIPHFRTTTDQVTERPSPDLMETVQTMEKRQQFMRDYLIELGQEKLNFVGSATVKDHPKRIAQNIRDTLGLSDGWASEWNTWQNALRMLIDKIEEIGILVMVNGIVGNNTHRKLDVNEFRGFVLVDEYAPLIFVNGADGKAAQMFTLAHELAHIWIGVSAAFDLQKLHPADHEIELFCNYTAAEFLVPENQLLNIWSKALKDSERFQHIARNFKVSELVVARRALDLRLISKDEFFEFYRARLEKDLESNQDSSGGNFYATQNLRIGRRFSEAVIRNTKEGKVLYQEAYRLTGLTGKTFDEFAERLGVGRFS